MQWAPDQDNALSKVSDWLQDPSQQVFRLFGYAGTGKTTLARHFAEGIEGSVMFGAYTGKAAYVLRNKGCTGASTIHSMIYHTKEKGKARLKELEQSLVGLIAQLQQEQPSAPDQTFSQHRRVNDIKVMVAAERKALSRPAFALNPDSNIARAKLVVIDECSMVDSKMGEDLLSFGTKILVLGDPAQLPPVMGGGFFTEGCKPDVMLTDIHRQAKDNPIIAMATKVRNQQQLALGSYGNSSVVDKDGVCPQDALDADQILVGRNKTRHGSNRRVRSLRGITEDYPVVSDKLVCLRNNHENGLLNGAIWHIDDVGNKDDKRIIMTLSPDEGDENRTIEVESHVQHFLGQEVPFWERKEAEEFDYGYALTVHKSQGSQWDNVILFDEAACFREDRWRWLYTGITRAAETLKVVRL